MPPACWASKKLLICGNIIFLVAGFAMLFITVGWKWGLAGIAIYWLLVVLVDIPIAGYANKKMAIRKLEEVANSLQDRDEKTQYLLSAAEIQLHISKKASIQAYRRILDIDPDCVLAHFNLAVCYADVGKQQLARQEYHFVEKHDLEAAQELATIFEQLGVRFG
ncbi:MAG: hypothetical protein J7L19_03175 [Dehalococcoidia bacterium]|nr:hypothetical protein [Dehalococcoidia bacterium]